MVSTMHAAWRRHYGDATARPDTTLASLLRKEVATVKNRKKSMGWISLERHLEIVEELGR